MIRFFKAKTKAIEKEVRASELERLTTGRPSAVVDTRVVYCGDNLEQLKRSGRIIRAITVRDILDEQVACKLA